jgi:hypothetical protein
MTIPLRINIAAKQSRCSAYLVGDKRAEVQYFAPWSGQYLVICVSRLRMGNFFGSPIMSLLSLYVGHLDVEFAY